MTFALRIFAAFFAAAAFMSGGARAPRPRHPAPGPPRAAAG